MNKNYQKPAMRVVNIQPCHMLAQSDRTVRGTNDGWNWGGNVSGDDR
ncbi:MAG: hypothetical protein IJR87_07165 [Bacteroidaceae bacterium]|nr:hypothetical protein [Bacteroidaceae bacterium]